jgi:3-dehydroquinate synthetase
MALIKDLRLFNLLCDNQHQLVCNRFRGDGDEREIFRRAIQGMLEELSGNLWEEELERSVDYGHTFSPLLEMYALPELLHGEAVSIDMALCLALSYNRGLIESEEYIQAIQLLRCVGLPITHQLCTPEFLWLGIEDATRHRDGLQRIPLPAPIGSVTFVNNITFEELGAALETLHCHTQITESLTKETA